MRKPVLYLRTVHWFGLTSGGSVTHTAGVINGISKYMQISVVSNDNLAGVKVYVKKVNPYLKNVPFIGELLYNLKIIKKIRNTDDFQFLYQRYSGESFCGAYLAQKNGIPFVLEFNSSEVWKLNNWSRSKNIFKYLIKRFIQYPVVRKIELYNLKIANLIVVVSDPLKESLILEGVKKDKILVNPNGVDLEKFALVDNDNSIRESLGFDEGHIVVGFIGTFGPWHGVIEMAKAILHFFKFAKKEILEKTFFLIIGTGKLMPAVKEIISKSPFSQRVIFSGPVPQGKSPKYLAACDLFLSPHIPNPDGSKFFGSPTKLFEYMAMRRPIIASNLDQIGEILTHKETAYLVPPGDIKALSNAIEFLIEHPDLRQRLKENAFRLVSSKYTWDAHVERIFDRLNKMGITSEQQLDETG